MDFTQTMEFIETNYVWILVVGIITLMTVIGYFAEKSNNFSKEKPEKIKKQKKEKEEVIEELPVDESAMDFYTDKVNPLDDFKMELPVDNDEEMVIDSFEPKTDDNSFEQSFVEPLNETADILVEEEPIDEELYSDFGETETEEESDVDPISETVNKQEIESGDNSWGKTEEEPALLEEEPVLLEEEPMDNWENNNDEEIKSEIISELPANEENNVENLGIELPSIETLNQEIKDVVDEEDVWKF